MTEASETIECGEHGTRERTYVCRHLVTGTGGGFNRATAPDDPDGLWPDAWCDACEAVRDAAGGWNERSEAQADICVVCDSCYERARERNWKQDDDAFHALATTACEWLQTRQDALVEATAIAAYLLEAEGAYRTPDDNGFTFLVMTSVHKVE